VRLRGVVTGSMWQAGVPCGRLCVRMSSCKLLCCWQGHVPEQHSHPSADSLFLLHTHDLGDLVFLPFSHFEESLLAAKMAAAGDDDAEEEVRGGLLSLLCCGCGCTANQPVPCTCPAVLLMLQMHLDADLPSLSRTGSHCCWYSPAVAACCRRVSRRLLMGQWMLMMTAVSSCSRTTGTTWTCAWSDSR
jgi:hypothetical protein